MDDESGGRPPVSASIVSRKGRVINVGVQTTVFVYPSFESTSGARRSAAYLFVCSSDERLFAFLTPLENRETRSAVLVRERPGNVPLRLLWIIMIHSTSDVKSSAFLHPHSHFHGLAK